MHLEEWPPSWHSASHFNDESVVLKATRAAMVCQW